MPAPVAVVLVTGSFALPEFYDAVTSAVNAHDGVEMTVPHLPSVGLKTGPRPGVPPPTMHDDAAHVAGEIARLADAGQDVIVVSHSYGGFPATESIRGLEKAARLRQGREAGGVVRLAYMTALVGREGVAAADVPHEVPKEHKGKISVDVRGGCSTLLDVDVIADVTMIGRWLAFLHRPGSLGQVYLLGPPPGRGREVDATLSHALVCELPGHVDICRLQICPSVVPRRRGGQDHLADGPKKNNSDDRKRKRTDCRYSHDQGRPLPSGKCSTGGDGLDSGVDQIGEVVN